jgi:hypothetical protein
MIEVVLMKINKNISLKGLHLKTIKNSTFIHRQKTQKLHLF